jgi:hypothetical protein
MKRNFVLLLIASLALTGALWPATARSQGSPFGGVVSLTIPCMCTRTTWIWFTPLYLGGPAVITGALVYSPFTSVLYANLNIGVPGKWHIGDYFPGVQACWIPVKISGHWICIPLPSLGLINKVGTN